MTWSVDRKHFNNMEHEAETRGLVPKQGDTYLGKPISWWVQQHRVNPRLNHSTVNKLLAEHPLVGMTPAMASLVHRHVVRKYVLGQTPEFV